MAAANKVSGREMQFILAFPPGDRQRFPALPCGLYRRGVRRLEESYPQETGGYAAFAAAPLA
jgi:hypothetical protein